MGSLISKISSLASVGYGINIFEQSPPQNISGVKTNVAGCVGAFPWGPTTMQTVTSWQQLFDLYCPSYFDAADTYPALKAFLSKKFPGGLKMVRAVASDAVLGTMDYDDEDATESVTVVAKYLGLLGNSVLVEWAANADTAANRDAIVSIGTAYSERYENVVVAAGLVVTDPGDPFVTFSKHASCVKVPEVAAALALASGSDGTLAGADLVGSAVSNVGIRKFYDENISINALFVADLGDDDTLIDAVNVGLFAYVGEDKGLAVLMTKYDQTVAEAIVDVASYNDDRCVYPFPLAKCKNFYDTNLTEIEVQGGPWVAAAIVQNDPWQAPGGAASVEALKGITALEEVSITRTNYESLNTAGIAPFFMSTALGGAIVRRAVTTATDGTRIFRRRLTDYLTESIAAYLERFVEYPIDLDLDAQTLGNYTKTEVDAVTTFLENEKQAQHAKDYGIDPFSANTEAGIDAGRWVLAIQVETFSMQEEIVLQAEVGETVVVQAA
jgi:hypothetical protein